MQEKSFVIHAIPDIEMRAIHAKLSPNEKLLHIADKVIEQLVSVADMLEAPIILRDVNKDALPWLTERSAIGKNMAVHGKTSELPMLAGLIPLQASISKAGASNNLNKIRDANKENQDTVKESQKLIAQYQTVLDPKEKGQLFLELGTRALCHVPLISKTGHEIFIFEDKDKRAFCDRDGPVFAIQFKGSYYKINSNHMINYEDGPINIKSKFHPTRVEVFAKPTFERSKGNITGVAPITADIDVLAYGSKTHNLEHSTYLGKKTSHDTSHHDMIGQGPQIIHDLIEQVMAPGLGRDLISHGPEQYNIDYVQQLTPPWPCINPGGKVEILHTEEDLLKKFNKHKPQTRLTAEGMKATSLEPNPHWGWELKPNRHLTQHEFVINSELKELFEYVDRIAAAFKDPAIDQSPIQRLCDAKKRVGELYLKPESSVGEKEELKDLLEKQAIQLGNHLRVQRKSRTSIPPIVLPAAEQTPASFKARNSTSHIFDYDPSDHHALHDRHMTTEVMQFLSSRESSRESSPTPSSSNSFDGVLRASGSDPELTRYSDPSSPTHRIGEHRISSDTSSPSNASMGRNDHTQKLPSKTKGFQTIIQERTTSPSGKTSGTHVANLTEDRATPPNGKTPPPILG